MNHESRRLHYDQFCDFVRKARSCWFATQEINGVFDDAGPALREARHAIFETAPNAKSYKVRLIDFHNDPTTTLADIQKLLQIVEERLTKQLAEKPVNK